MKFGKVLTLTALATGITTGTFGFVTSSAQAISLGGFRFPNFFLYEFEIDTEATSSSTGEFSDAVTTLIIDEDDDPNTTPLVSLSNENLIVSEVNLSTLSDSNTGILFEEFFNNINNTNIDFDLNPNGFIFKVDVDREVTTNNFGNIDFEDAGFIVPEQFLTSGIDPLNDLSSLNNLANVDIEFPLFEVYSGANNPNGLNTSGQEAGINFSVNQSIPESNTSVSLLALGFLGTSTIIFKRTLKRNIKD